MSVIEAEVEVDETDIPNVQLGQTAKITIDAIPGKTFTAKVTEIGNSPIQATGTAASQATNFKVALHARSEIPDVRPGFTCTAEITTATRKNDARRADPGDDGPRDGGRRQGADRPGTGDTGPTARPRAACRPPS